MSSLFKGLGEFSGGRSSPFTHEFRSGEVYVAQVLEIIKDNDNPIGIGAIRINRGNQSITPENEVPTIAEPLDRNHYRLPLTGEQVLVIQQNGKYYYFTVVTSVANLLTNIDPSMMLTAVQSSGTSALLTDTDAERKRFESKVSMTSTLLESKTQLPSRIREGDTILEGRLGGVIKLTQTITKDGVWDKQNQITNIGESYDGDPMLVMKSNIRRKSFDDLDIVNPPMQGLEDDNINQENSSIYLTTTQNIPIQLASSKKFFSWTANVVAAGSSILSDPTTAVLSSLIPETFDPNQEVQVVVSGMIMSEGPGGAGPGNGASLGLQESELLAYEVLIAHEGFGGGEAGWDINQWRIGHGSSTFTLDDGTVVRMPGDKTQWPVAYDRATKAFTYVYIGNEVEERGHRLSNGYVWHSKDSGRTKSPIITIEDAHRDLARRVRDEFLPATKRDTVAACTRAGLDGEAIWTALGKGAHAALCSIKYNYGNVTQNGAANAAAASRGDRNVLANWIENSLQGGSKQRHREEAFTCRTGTLPG